MSAFWFHPGRRLPHEPEPRRHPAGRHPLLRPPVSVGRPVSQAEGRVEPGPTGTPPSCVHFAFAPACSRLRRTRQRCRCARAANVLCMRCLTDCLNVASPGRVCVCAAGASVRVCVCVFLLDSSRGGVGGNLYLQNVLTILYGVCVYVPLRHSRWLADLQRVCVCLCVRVHAGSVNRVNRLISTLPPLFFFFFFSPLPFLFGPFICRSSSPPPACSQDLRRSTQSGRHRWRGGRK